MFCNKCSTLDVSIFRRRLELWCCVFFFSDRNVRAESSGDKVQIALQALHIMRMSLCVAGAVWDRSGLCGMLFSVASIVFSGCTTLTLRFTLLTLHFRVAGFERRHSTLETSQAKLYTPLATLCVNRF